MVASPTRAAPPRMDSAATSACESRRVQACRSSARACRASSTGVGPACRPLVEQLTGPVEDRPAVAGGSLVALDRAQLLGSQALEAPDHLRGAQRVVVGQRPVDDGGGRGVRRRAPAAAPPGVVPPRRAAPPSPVRCCPAARPGGRSLPLLLVDDEAPHEERVAQLQLDAAPAFGEQARELFDYRHRGANRSQDTHVEGLTERTPLAGARHRSHCLSHAVPAQPLFGSASWLECLTRKHELHTNSSGCLGRTRSVPSDRSSGSTTSSSSASSPRRPDAPSGSRPGWPRRPRRRLLLFLLVVALRP